MILFILKLISFTNRWGGFTYYIYCFCSSS